MILLLAIIVLPLLARGQYSYLLPLAQLCGIWAIVVLGLTLLMGFTGQVSLGHAGWFALGAYGAGVASSAYHVSLWPAMFIGIAAGGLLAFIAGVSILRLKGHHLALATLCIGVIIYEVITKMEITGGAAGLNDLPQLHFFGDSDLSKVYLIWFIVLLVMIWATHLTESPAGRALRAIHGDEDAAESLGISVFSVKVKVFVASGILASLAGVLYAFVYTPSYLGPEPFTLIFSVLLVTMVVIGGMGNIWGALAGAAVLTGMNEVIRLVGERLGSTQMSKYEELISGLILVLIMIFSNDGLIPGLRRIFQRKRS